MALHEGCRRLRTAGQTFTIIGLGLLIVGGFMAIATGLGAILYISFPITLLGILLWLAAWITAGFVGSVRSDSDRS